MYVFDTAEICSDAITGTVAITIPKGAFKLQPVPRVYADESRIDVDKTCVDDDKIPLSVSMRGMSCCVNVLLISPKKKAVL